jgi:hypothetical protein
MRTQRRRADQGGVVWRPRRDKTKVPLPSRPKKTKESAASGSSRTRQNRSPSTAWPVQRPGVDIGMRSMSLWFGIAPSHDWPSIASWCSGTVMVL